MDTNEMVRRSFSLLRKIGISAALLAWMGLWIFAFVNWDSPPFWAELFLMASLAWKTLMLFDIWEG